LTKEPIAIVGAGSIGGAWAIVFARAGHPVRIYDIDQRRITAIPDEISKRVAALVLHELLPSVEDIMERISYGTDLAAAVVDVPYVQECVLESVDVKREVFTQIGRAARPNAVLASSTSMITCSQFAGELPGRTRCLVVHPGNPPYLLPVAELVPAPFTAPETVDRPGSYSPTPV